MSVMIEVHYREPVDDAREQRLTGAVDGRGGRLTFREVPGPGGPSRAVVLTFEFKDREHAENAARDLRRMGEHVEGPADYG